jgi:hypothetical protein
MVTKVKQANFSKVADRDTGLLPTGTSGSWLRKYFFIPHWIQTGHLKKFNLVAKEIVSHSGKGKKRLFVEKGGSDEWNVNPNPGSWESTVYDSQNFEQLYVTYSNIALKSQSNEIFYLQFFSQMASSQAPYSVFKTLRNLSLNLRRHPRFLIDFPLLFIAEILYMYSLYCFIWKVATLCIITEYWGVLFFRIICTNSHLSLNTESRYSQYCLIQRVTTQCFIHSRESLLTAESYFQQFWRTLPSFKGTMKQKMNYASRALFSKNIVKES